MNLEVYNAGSNEHLPAPEQHERGRQLVDAVVRRYRPATVTWDYSDKPQSYRVTVKRGHIRVTIQFEGEMLADHKSEEFSRICDGLLERLRRLFGPSAGPN